MKGRSALTLVAFALGLVGLPVSVPASLFQARQLNAPEPPKPTSVYVSAVDSHGRPVAGLGAGDFTVRIDGRPRRVIEAQRVAGAGMVVIAVDETSLDPAAARAAGVAAGRLLIRLRPSDRAAVVTLPLAGRAIDITSDRSQPREALKKIVGRGGLLSAGAGALEADRAATGDRPPIDAVDEVPARMHAGRVIGDLQHVAEALGPIPGSKAILLLTGGVRADDRDADAMTLADTAARAGVVMHVLQVRSTATEASASARSAFDRLAAAGGTFIRLEGDPAPAIERLMGVMSGVYRLALEAAASDLQGCHDLKVTSARKGATLWASRRWAARDEPLAGGRPERPATPPANADVIVTPDREPAAPDPELTVILVLAGQYLRRYIVEFSAVVAEERYEQQTWRGARRKLVSDFLLVQGPDGGWLPFRDVFEVDGVPVRDREDRLRRLFIENPVRAVDEAKRITDEGARYNLGGVYRNLNVPTLPLMFLERLNQPRFQFRRHGEETIDGIRLVRVDYAETTRPTIIRTSTDGNVPARGRFWIDPMTGRVHKTQMSTGVKNVSLDATVTYQANEVLGLWVPAEMKEEYKVRTETITGTASYSNFRRFQVIVEETIKVPKR